MLIVMGLLTWIGAITPVPGTEQELLILRKTNLATLAVWGLWWPCMILGAVVAGRLWCAVCPMELMNRLGHLLGRNLGPARLRLGSFLRAGWVILGLYVVMQFLVAGLALHRMPTYTAWMLGTMLVLALGSGVLIREERSFCKGFCPAQALLSVYGRFTPLQLDKMDAATCASCTTRECVQPDLRERFDARSCPSHLRPFERTASDGCVLCLQCVKVCPKANLGWGLRSSKPGSSAPELLKPYEAGFVLIAIGFVAHEVLGEIPSLEGLFHAIPISLNRWAPRLVFGWVEALWFLGLFPLAFWIVVVQVARLLGSRQPTKALLLAAATGAAPVVALAHAGKALAKLGAWSGFLPLALHEPTGVRTMASILARQQPTPAAIYGVSAVGWGMALALAWLAFRAVANPDPGEKRPLATGQAMALGLFFVGALAWIGH